MLEPWQREFSVCHWYCVGNCTVVLVALALVCIMSYNNNSKSNHSVLYMCVIMCVYVCFMRDSVVLGQGRNMAQITAGLTLWQGLFQLIGIWAWE